MKWFASALLGAVLYSNVAHAGPDFSVEDDKFSSSVKITGPQHLENLKGSFLLGNYPTELFMFRSWVDKKTGLVTHQLYVDETYTDTGWKFFDIANDDKARPHNLVSINRNVEKCDAGGFVQTCDYDETFGIDFTDEQMKEYASSGLEIKVSAKDGSSQILSVPAKVVTSQLAVINKYMPADKQYALDPGLTPYLPKREMKLSVKEDKRGAFVNDIDHSSDFYRAGVKWLDFIKSVNGTPTDDQEALQKAYDGVKPGDAVTVVVHRGWSDTSLTFLAP